MSKRVLLLLANGFEELEAAAFTDVLGWSRAEGDVAVEVLTVGRSKRIKGTWSLTVIPEMQIQDVNPDSFDALALPGGFEEAGYYEDAYSDEFLNLIRSFNKNRKYIASVCVGALPLGKSGILEGREATTYCHLDSLRPQQLESFGACIVDQRIVVSENIITSSGPATALDVAFLLLEQLTGKDNCNKVRSAMGFPRKS